MTAFNRWAATLGFALVSAQAQAAEFSFTSDAGLSQAYGNIYTAMVDGVTLTASAWSNTEKAKQFESAALKIDPGFGMGVCSRAEGVDCTASQFKDALGNNGASDLILFSFSSAVRLQSLAVLQFGGDSDLSLWAGNGTFTPNGMKAGLLGTATLFENTSRVNDIGNVSLTAFTGTYDWLAIAARINQKNDFAKLQSLTINPVAQVPETATWMTMLAGLGLVGFAVQRRTQT